MSLPRHVQMTQTVYDHSANLYVQKVGTTIDARFESTQDQAALKDFARSVLTGPPGAVLDIGCGPGRATAFLADNGLDISGIDISEEMIRHAQIAHPHLHFEVGALQALPAKDNSLAGASLWYSIIHVPPAELNDAWRELHRVLRPDAHMLVAFQSGDGKRVERLNAHGSNQTLIAFHHDPKQVGDTLCESGFSIDSVSIRDAELDHESTPQTIVVATRNRSSSLSFTTGD